MKPRTTNPTGSGASKAQQLKFVLSAFVANLTFRGGPLTLRIEDRIVRVISSESVLDEPKAKTYSNKRKTRLFLIPDPRGPLGKVQAETHRDVGLKSEDIPPAPKDTQVRMDPADLAPAILTKMEAVWDELEALSYRVVGLLRWRFHVPVATGQFEATYRMIVPRKREVIEVGPQRVIESTLVLMPREDKKRELNRLLRRGASEPLSSDFLWEARHLLERRHSRGALVMAVNAAEIGVKGYITQRIPEASWLMENVPSPPLHKLLKDYLPQLASSDTVSLSSNVLREFQRAVETRNRIVHKGESVGAAESGRAVDCVARLLHHLDRLNGHAWSFAG